MEAQNFANHRRNVPIFHFVLLPIILLTLIGSFVNLYQSWGDHQRQYSASLIVVIMVCLALVSVIARLFSLKAQDRAIRAEENLRHYVMTGKLLDPKLTVRQIIGLRFASDQEFVELAGRAVEENLTEAANKKTVKNWRADTYRV